MGVGPLEDFIDQEEDAEGVFFLALGQVHDLLEPLDLRKKPRRPLQQRVLHPNRSSDMHRRGAIAPRRNRQSALREHHRQSGRPHQRALPGHVGAGDDE